MSRLHSNRGTTRLQVGVTIALVLGLFCLFAVLWRYEDVTWFPDSFESKVQKLHIIETMSRHLLASADAEKSAVMADTDEASQAFAARATEAAQTVEQGRRDLEPLLESAPQAVQLFGEFSSCWNKLQEIDREVLALAVQNTNLKAFRLSFVAAAEAIQRMETAINHLMDTASPSPHAVGITRRAAQAVIAALHLYTRHAPHIAESTAARMDEIEADMHRLDTQVTEALQSLPMLVDEPGRPFLEAAWAAYKDFQTIQVEILALSRQNTNIRSAALSLGQKRKVMAQCQEVLAALQETVQHSLAYKATR